MTNRETGLAAANALAVLLDSWNRSARGDPSGPALYGTGYWPDAELVDPSGNIWPGQPAIVQMHVDLWQTAFKGSVLKGSIRRIRELSPTIMIVDLDLELTLVREAPVGSTDTDGAPKTHLKHVMEKRGSEWKVIAAQNTFYSDGKAPH